jgi:ribose 5-phosphate isomerase B
LAEWVQTWCDGFCKEGINAWRSIASALNAKILSHGDLYAFDAGTPRRLGKPDGEYVNGMREFLEHRFSIPIKGKNMRIGIATDHGGFHLKEELVKQLLSARHQVVEFGAYRLDESDDYPNYVVPLAQAVAAQEVERGVAICGSGVGASVCANKIAGIRAALIHDHFSARQGVEDDHMNILCMGGRTIGSAVAWDLVQTFLAAQFSQAPRHLRRLGKIASLEAEKAPMA